MSTRATASMPMLVPMEDLLANLVVVDIDAVVAAAVAERLAETERREFVMSVAAGVPASEAYLTARRLRR